jgi:hypothetical protein
MPFQIAVCRVSYKLYRKACKAPVILAMKTHWGWFVEVKETGEILFENHQACCSWQAKSDGVTEWTERHGEE